MSITFMNVHEAAPRISATHEDEMAGSAVTLAGHGDAKASSPALQNSSADPAAPASIHPGGDSSPGAAQEAADRGDHFESEGEHLFDRVHSFLLRFVSLPSNGASVAVVLWAAHTHLMEAWDTTPRLAFLSPEPGSGKSRAMEITALLVPRALESSNASSAALLRSMKDPLGTPTFLIDEIDAKYGSAAKGDEDLRSMINAGHRRGNPFLRCGSQGEGFMPTRQETFAAVAVAGLGNLPDTIMVRSVVIRMRKRKASEVVEPFRHRDHKHLGHALRDELEAWAATVAEKAAAARPILPPAINDRIADVWEPLISVADLAGGQWPARGREAASQLIAAAKSGGEASLGLQLLSDVHRCFKDEERLTTEELLTRLLADEEAPWGDLWGKRLDPRKLAALLRPYGVSSCSIRMPNGSTPKGYKREAFKDAWSRYPPPPTSTAPTSADRTTN